MGDAGEHTGLSNVGENVVLSTRDFLTPALPCASIKVLPPNRGAGGDKGLRTMRAGVGLVPARGFSLPIPPEEEEERES